MPASEIAALIQCQLMIWRTQKARAEPLFWAGFCTAAAAGAVAVSVVMKIPTGRSVDIFRGFLQNALEPRIGAWPAVIVASLAFALMHGVTAAIPIFGLSLILGVVMLRTRRITACWFVHALHNGLTTGLLYLAPETFLEQFQ
jgi:hypothetical protein